MPRLDLKEVMEKVNELHPPKKEEPEETEEEVIDLEAKPEIRCCSGVSEVDL